MPPHAQAQEYLDKANQLADQKKFNAAFAQFEIAIKRHHGNAQAHTDFGYALLKAGNFPEAVEQLRRAAEINPVSAFDINQLVEAFLHDSRQEKDVEEFQKTVDKVDRAELFHVWAQVLASLDRSDRAIEEFKRALKKNPELELDTDSLAAAFNNSGTVEPQIAAFQKEVDQLKNAAAWNTWGKTLMGLGRQAVAANQFKIAACAKSDGAEPYINWGKALIETADYELASAVLKKALKCDEHSVNAYLYRGDALRQLEEHDQAVSNYEVGSAKAPADTYFEPWLDSLRKLPNPDPAIAEYKLALERSYSGASFPSPYMEFGEFLKELDRMPESAIQFARSLAFENNYEAASELQQILADLPEPQTTLDAIQKIFDTANNFSGYAEWSKILARINKADRARQQLPKMLALLTGVVWNLSKLKEIVSAFESPRDRRSAQDEIGAELNRLRKGELEVKWARMLWEDFNDLPQSLALYRKVLLCAPTSSRLAEGFARALRAATDQDRAAAIKDTQAAVINAKQAVVSYYWALVLINLDKQKLAIQELQRAIGLEHDRPDAHYQLARLYYQQGNYTKACQEFQKTVQLKQDHTAAIDEWGTALLKDGRKEEAIEKHLEAVKTRAALSRRPFNPAQILSLLFEGPTQQQEGGLLALRDKLNWDDETVARFQKVFDEIHEAESYQEWGSMLAAIKRQEQAIQQFKNAIELDPDIPSGYSEWLKALGALGLSTQRIADYEQTLIKNRNNADGYNELADFLWKMKRTELAAQKYQQALERDPKNTHSRAWLAYSLLITNDIEQARKEARQLLVDDPSNDLGYHCLSWGAYLDGDFDEAIKQCELGIEYGHLYLYGTCTRALYKSGREDLAVIKLEEANQKKPDDTDLLYGQGASLMEMNRNDEAALIFQRVVELKPDHVYAHHTLAMIPYAKGQYEEAWKKWIQALDVYKQRGSLFERALERDESVDSDEPFYHASVILAIQHKHDEAERILKEGLDFDPDNMGILRLLADLNWERKEELIGTDPDINRRRSEYHWDGMKYFLRAEKLLKERTKRYPNYYFLVDLGDLYLLREDYEKARGCFEEARTKDDASYVLYARLGVVELREKKPDKAIPLLQEALKRNPNDLDVKSSLAEAYLRAEKLDDAESTYREVLNIAPNHVQSCIGLGELFSALGDKKEYDRYSEAIDYFTRALDVAANEKIRSKYLKTPEKAAIHYQLGYARVQMYENSGIRRDNKLLKEARKDFECCIALNPSHQKARRAKEKIDKRVVGFSRDRLTEKYGPLTIFGMSILIFVVAQLAFYLAPFLNRPSLIVSDKSLKAVEKQVPQETLESLKKLKNREFSTRAELVTAIQPLLKTDVETVTDAVLQNVESVKPVNFPELGGGSYALLTFGSLLFMVVGLYLPQILKLSVGGIVLEKSSVEQATAGGTLGIAKLG